MVGCTNDSLASCISLSRCSSCTNHQGHLSIAFVSPPWHTAAARDDSWDL